MARVSVLALLVATQMVGWGEEGMFRGIGVTTLREHGLSEGRVALWSSLIFGAVHLTNAVGRGAEAIPQALIVSFAGYFFARSPMTRGSLSQIWPETGRPPRASSPSWTRISTN